MPRPVHFEIHADDPERAAAFYRSVFDWEIEKWEGPQEYWPVTTGPEGTPGCKDTEGNLFGVIEDDPEAS